MTGHMVSAAKLMRGVALTVGNAPDMVGSRYRGTDKFAHGYLTFYRRHFSSIRFKRLLVFEIGVGGVEKLTPGGSLPLWRDYFPRSTIVGIDLHEKDVQFGHRVHFAQADQSDPDQLAGIVTRHGRPNIVIDDGSHVGAHIWTSFETLWAHVEPGGWYVVEDLATSYVSDYGGATPPPRLSGVGLVQSLADQIQSRDLASQIANGAASDICAAHCYPGIAFFQKAVQLLPLNES